jgi:hypothetical protein
MGVNMNAMQQQIISPFDDKGLVAGAYIHPLLSST